MNCNNKCITANMLQRINFSALQWLKIGTNSQYHDFYRPYFFHFQDFAGPMGTPIIHGSQMQQHICNSTTSRSPHDADSLVQNYDNRITKQLQEESVKKLSVWEQSPAALHRSWTNCHLSVTVNIMAAGVIRCCISTAEALGVTIYCIRLNNDQPQLFLAPPFWAACNKKQTDLYKARNFRVLSTTMHTKKTIVTSQDRQRKTIQRTFQHFYQIGMRDLQKRRTSI